MALPKWISPIKGKDNHFVIDPDIYYPELLAELGVEKPNKYWLEVALGCMKLDSQVHLAMNKAATPGRAVEKHIRADDGRKQRWNHTMFPAGKVPKLPDVVSASGVAWSDLTITERARHIRYHYRRIRGFVPAG